MGKSKKAIQPLKLIFATNNPYKVEEIQEAVGKKIQVISLQDAGIVRDIPEPHPTLRENALEKSRTIYLLTDGKNCFSEDTGLEVYILHGEPGVRSARYAGEPASAAKNIQKLLERLNDTNIRKARFRTVISLIWDDQEYFFEGVCDGHILRERRGTQGFGYDPVFMPEGATKSFAEMTLTEKNQYSHRRKAVDQMVSFLKEHLTKPKPRKHGENKN
ncbi:MAG TPA: RdgB/HAM1 family non-canonical purine NTP pyrophosphatase [Puia sp.]|nr:RdgB/HAM1 family non-canonical purine NTP pyrophosphatase [Puia sp.]